MKAYPYLVQGNNIVVVIDGKSHTISKTHITYEQVKAAIVAGDWEKVKDVIEPKKVVLSYGKGNVSIQGETLYWKGNELNNGLAVRMINMLQEGFPIDPMVAFMENLMKNPSKRAVTELYGFLETGSMPITPGGCFLAYKKVDSNYMDVHSGTVLNKPADKMTAEEAFTCSIASPVVKKFGKKGEVTVEIVNGKTVISMERNEVNDDKDQICSEGLHFCSEAYLSNFSGARVVILKINPADVVSIPSDYRNTKGRTCKYTVIGEVGVDSAVDDKQFTKSVQSNANSITPKSGSTEFYRGYTDGFNDNGYQGPRAAAQNRDHKGYSEGFDKGDDDRRTTSNPRYIYTARTVEPSVKGPKLGNSAFYVGYSDGFNDAKYDADDFDDGNESYTDYDEGYVKGESDRENGMPERYRYVAQV